MQIDIISWIYKQLPASSFGLMALGYNTYRLGMTMSKGEAHRTAL